MRRGGSIPPYSAGVAPGPDEQSVALTRDYRLLQLLGGHRYSVDDMLVGHLAATRAVAPRRILDLGCGVGSVLLMVGWAFRDAELAGIEAQPVSAALALRNLALNGCAERGRIVEGDLRDEATLASLGGAFDLVTGSPPYFDPRASTVSPDPQRAYARWEMRGGIEDYARAAARMLAPGGLFVACASTDPPGRASAALASAGLALLSRRDVLPHPDRPAFLTLLVATKAPTATAVTEPPLLLRHADGARTAEHIAIRGWFGIESGPY